MHTNCSTRVLIPHTTLINISWNAMHAIVKRNEEKRKTLMRVALNLSTWPIPIFIYPLYIVAVIITTIIIYFILLLLFYIFFCFNRLYKIYFYYNMRSSVCYLFLFFFSISIWKTCKHETIVMHSLDCFRYFFLFLSLWMMF